MLDEATGELSERRLYHQTGEADAFYRSVQGPVRVWRSKPLGRFAGSERLLAELWPRSLLEFSPIAV